MSASPLEAWLFAVVVVQRGDRFLLVHERKHGQRWYLPAGRVEPGETLAQAAARETLEEAGVEIRLRGVIRFELTHGPADLRLRAVFLAEPVGNTPPKRVADAHSLGACWVSLAELPRYALRGDDVRAYLEHVARGGAVAPMSVLAAEGAPLAAPR